MISTEKIQLSQSFYRTKTLFPQRQLAHDDKKNID